MLTKRSLNKTAVALALACLTTLVVSGAAWAFTEPVDGDLFFEVYDLAMNKIFTGAAGVVIAGLMVMGAFVLMGMGRGFLSPLLLLLCGAAVFFIKDIVMSFGYSLDVAQTAKLLM
ncbi:MAG: hypothetical protein LBP38_06835 [Desulfovibrio sp.]|jgi:hypothetical protein|nr:hypothetical protein [Desulfovibrio sp.]